jgi:hypothetical protein
MKVWLTTMCQSGDVENLKELFEPILEYFHGIIVVVHDSTPDDPAVRYLESIKGEGEIIHRKFIYRHNVSMNETLFCGKIQEGDLVMWTDALERPGKRFCSVLNTEVNTFMLDGNFDMLAFYGKPFVFRYNEAMQYVGSPHWGLHGWTNGFELNRIYNNERDVRLNIRPIKRPDPRHFVKHYAHYYVAYPAGSNSALLGLEKNGDPKELFPIVETRRLEFRKELRSRGLPLNVDSVIELFNDELDDVIKGYINNVKELNDLYREYVLKDSNFPDDHDFKNVIKV